MILEFSVKGYRSLQDISVSLNNLNVIIGPNGSGKSNLYHALRLLAKSAEGSLAKTLALEGGMPSVLWAGDRKLGHSGDPIRMIISLRTDKFTYELALGLPKGGISLFNLDPEVKHEAIWYGKEKRRSTNYLERKTGTTWIMNDSGERVCYPLIMSQSESVLSQLHEPHLYPELSCLREMMRGWRFYHHFRTDMGSPVRQPQIGVRTPVLSDCGIDVAAALQTIKEVGDHDALRIAIDEAFPGSELIIKTQGSRFELLLQQKGMKRPFEARELSDGTLRYLCLIAALLSPRPSDFLAINEPEMSLHPDLIEPLANLIYRASKNSQIWVTTHSKRLAVCLEDLSKQPSILLHKTSGFTELV
ncbi:MAG: AAA family ATPase [Candidatus Berkiella sp.]